MNASMSAAQSAQQNNRGPGGQYSFGTHAEPDGLALNSEVVHESALEILQSAVGTSRDPQNVQERPRDYVAVVDIGASSAASLLNSYDCFVENYNDFAMDELPPSTDIPAGATGFQLIEKSPGEQLYEPRLVALTADGQQVELADFSELPDGFPDGAFLAPEDGDIENRSTMHHATEDWNGAAALTAETQRQRVDRSHALLASMGWELKSYDGRGKEWSVGTGAPGRAPLNASLNGSFGFQLKETGNWRLAQTGHLDSALGGAVGDEPERMLKAALDHAIRNPTPAMTRSVKRADLESQLSRIMGETPQDVADARALQAFMQGEPLRTDSPVAKIQARRWREARIMSRTHAKKLEESSQNLAAFKVELDQARGAVGPLVLEAMESQLATKQRIHKANQSRLETNQQTVSRIENGWKETVARSENATHDRARLKGEIQEHDAESARITSGTQASP